MADKVKLVIEIPKDIYARCKEYKLWSYDAETLEGAVATSKPLSDVLNEITGEIEREKFEYEQIKDFTRYYGLGIALEIIDKHIGDKE